MCLGLLQQREVLFRTRRSGVVEYDDLRRMPISPKVFVVLLNRLPYIAQAVSGDYETQIVFVLHNSSAHLGAPLIRGYVERPEEVIEKT